MLKNLNTQEFLDHLDEVGPDLDAIELVAEAEPKEEHPRDPGRWTILVVDDEEEVRHVMSRIVTRAGHEVVTAADGKSALKVLAQREDIDLVFLDAMMPKLDGLRTVARVRKGERNELPVVMVSGRTSGKHVMGGYKAGVDYYVTKPFRPRTIRNIMNYLLGELHEDECLDLEQLL